MKQHPVTLGVFISLIIFCSLLEAESPSRAIVVSGDLRIRSQPNLAGPVVGKLDEADTVVILDRTGEKMVIAYNQVFDLP